MLNDSSEFRLIKINGTIPKFPNKNDARRCRFEAHVLQMKKKKVSIELFYSTKAAKLSSLLEKTEGFAGINAGFWDSQKHPLDWCIYDAQVITPLTNYKRPYIIFDQKNAIIKNIDPKESTVEKQKEFLSQTKNILQTGPLLLENGQIQTDYSDYKIHAEDFDSDITKDRHPRTIFGYNQKYYYFVTINGRSPTSAGLYLEECAQLAQNLGLTDCINLDGGASSTLIVNKKLINSPRFSFIRGSRYLSAKIPGKERTIPTAIIARIQ